MGPLAAPPSPSLSGVAWGWRCLKGLVAMATIGFRGRHLVPASANRRWEPELQPRVTLLPPSHTVAKSRDPLTGVAESAQTDGQAHHGGPRDGGARAGTRSQAGEVSRADRRLDGQADRWMYSLLPFVLVAEALPSAHSALCTHTHVHIHTCTLTLGPAPQMSQGRVMGRQTKETARGRMNPPHHGPENRSHGSFTSDFTWRQHQRPPAARALGETATGPSPSHHSQR